MNLDEFHEMIWGDDYGYLDLINMWDTDEFGYPLCDRHHEGRERFYALLGGDDDGASE
jgi:hypothetical protein